MSEQQIPPTFITPQERRILTIENEIAFLKTRINIIHETIDALNKLLQANLDTKSQQKNRFDL